ncbi:MAG: hypothetical protein AAF939_22365 [Planctomycetota bacterium]
MMKRRRATTNSRWVYILMTITMLTLCPGCFEQLATLMYVVKGHKIPPKYAGLNSKKVAVVCVSDQSAYGPDTLTYTVAKSVSLKLSQGLKESQVISPAKIEDWMDQNSWSASDIAVMGKDLKADMVVMIEVGSYSIHEGATIFKGRADITVSVHDIAKEGQVTYVHGPEHYAFPKDGRPVIQTDERRFESFYLARLTDRISRLFVEHDKLDSFAEDAMLNY